jgi:valyl-tRNA synthetase
LDPRIGALLREEARSIRTLVKTAGDPIIEERGAARPRGAVMSVAAETEVLVALKGLVEGGKEGARVEREIKKVEKDLSALEKKLALPSFADKAPPEVVAEAKAQLEELRRKRAVLEDARGLCAELAE